MKLLVLDVEGTLFQTKIRLPGASIDSTIWQALASALGEDAIRAEVATHQRWDQGGYLSYLEWMKDTIRIHRKFGLTEAIFRQVIAAAEYQDGVVDMLRRIDRSQFEPVLVTGGFRELARRAQLDCDVSHAFAACEYLFAPDGRLAAFNLLPCDFAGKLDFVHLMLREYRLGDDDWAFVGDGRNDVPIAKEAPFSVGYRPHPELSAVSSVSISSYDELPSILDRITAKV